MNSLFATRFFLKALIFGIFYHHKSPFYGLSLNILCMNTSLLESIFPKEKYLVGKFKFFMIFPNKVGPWMIYEVKWILLVCWVLLEFLTDFCFLSQIQSFLAGVPFIVVGFR